MSITGTSRGDRRRPFTSGRIVNHTVTGLRRSARTGLRGADTTVSKAETATTSIATRATGTTRAMGTAQIVPALAGRMRERRPTAGSHRSPRGPSRRSGFRRLLHERGATMSNSDCGRLFEINGIQPSGSQSNVARRVPPLSRGLITSPGVSATACRRTSPNPGRSQGVRG